MKRVLAFLPLLGLLALPGSSGVAVGQTPTAGGVVSEDVEWVKFVPTEQSTSTGVTLDLKRKIMYLTSWKNLSTYDISDPENPSLLGTLPVGFMFENEDVAVDPQGKFMLFSESLPNDILHIYDVEDPTSIVEVASVPGAGDHTTTCILECDYAYGSDGSITDLRDYTNPKVIALDTDQNSWHNKIGLKGGAHDVTEVKSGFVINSPIDGGPQYIDVRTPASPKVLAVGDDPRPYSERGYLWHSGEWPNAGNDRWLLMQGEDNFNPQCSDQRGPFMTFDTTGWQQSHTFKKAHEFRVTNGVYADGNPPANALGCSAHWFRAHSTFNNGGLVVIAFYEHGTRFLKVAENGKISEAGYYLPYSGSTSASYWVNDELVYAVDYTRGIDILRWTGKTFAPAGGGGGGGGGGGDGGGTGGGGEALPGPGVKMRISDRTPPRGDTIRFRVTLRRCKGHKGTTVRLQRKVKGEFKSIASRPLGSNCIAKFTDVASYKQTSYRAIWPKQDDDHRAGKSRPQKVTTQS